MKNVLILTALSYVIAFKLGMQPGQWVLNWTTDMLTGQTAEQAYSPRRAVVARSVATPETKQQLMRLYAAESPRTIRLLDPSLSMKQAEALVTR